MAVTWSVGSVTVENRQERHDQVLRLAVSRQDRAEARGWLLAPLAHQAENRNVRIFRMAAQLLHEPLPFPDLRHHGDGPLPVYPPDSFAPADEGFDDKAVGLQKRRQGIAPFIAAVNQDYSHSPGPFRSASLKPAAASRDSRTTGFPRHP